MKTSFLFHARWARRALLSLLMRWSPCFPESLNEPQTSTNQGDVQTRAENSDLFLIYLMFLEGKGFSLQLQGIEGWVFESWHSSVRWDPEVEHEKNSLSSHDISKLVGNCTVISSSTFPPLYISSSPSFVVLFIWPTNKQYFLYGYIPIGLWCHWLRCLRTQLDPSRGGVLWTCRWILLLLHYVKHQNQYSSVHCKVAAFFFFFLKQGNHSLCHLI